MALFFWPDASVLATAKGKSRLELEPLPVLLGCLLLALLPGAGQESLFSRKGLQTGKIPSATCSEGVPEMVSAFRV